MKARAVNVDFFMMVEVEKQPDSISTLRNE
jgi:hypothetical protein